MTLASAQEAALAPVRAAMLRRAASHADRVIRDARRQADAIVAQARRDADQSVSGELAAARARAAVMAAAELSRGRHRARSILLSARRDARDELIGRASAAICGLRDEPGYARLLDRLTRLALAAAGPQATVTEHPAGGAVAHAPGVLVDCSLPRLASRAVEALGEQVRELWAP